MKKGMLALLVLLVSLGLASIASADVPAPGGAFNTAFNIQNLSSEQATCAIEFYDASGNLEETLNATIAGNDIADFYTGSSAFDGVSPGQYSAVVSCNREVAAVVNYSDSNSGASHAGLSEMDLSTTFYAPGIYNNYFNFYSNIVVQNATNSPNDITVNIYAPGSSSPVSTQTLTAPGYASVSFDQSLDGNLSQNVAYSAVIEGTGNIAPIVNIYGLGSSNEQLYSYNPFPSGATTLYSPIVMNNYYGYNTAITVQNIDTASANVTVTYSNGATESETIAPNSSHVFLNFGSGSEVPAGNTLYSATIESTNGRNIVGIVNQSNNYNRAATFTLFDSGSKTVNVPIVLRSYYGYDSSVNCQNITNTNATGTLSYASGQSTPLNIPAGETVSIVQLFDSELDGVSGNYISSATITASQDIVCVVNQDVITGSGATTNQDQLQSYEGIK